MKEQGICLEIKQGCLGDAVELLGLTVSLKWEWGIKASETDIYRGFVIYISLRLQAGLGPPAACNFRTVTNAFEFFNKISSGSSNTLLPALFSYCACACSCKLSMDSHSTGISCHWSTGLNSISGFIHAWNPALVIWQFNEERAISEIFSILKQKCLCSQNLSVYY